MLFILPMEATQKYLDRFSSIEDKQRRTYAGMMSAMDDAIGAVLDKLRATGLEENTLIFFISDNGGRRSMVRTTARLARHKAQTWEGGFAFPSWSNGKENCRRGKLTRSR